MKIEHVLAQKGGQVYTARPDQTVREVLAQLAAHNVGALVVVDERGRALGGISERGIVRAAGRDAGGSRRTGFYAAEQLLGRKDLVVDVDMFDRLPTPYGLVRYGVAPDHQKIKSVTAVYDRTAAHPRFRFFGNGEDGPHPSLDDL